MMKKVYGLIAFLLIASGLFAACDSNYSGSESATGSVQETVAQESTGSDATVNDSHQEESSSEEIEKPAVSSDYTFLDLEEKMYAKQSVNVRRLPCKDSEKVGMYTQAQEVIVTGQCIETNWYRVDYNGVTAYVSNNYVIADKPEIEVAKVEQQEQQEQQEKQEQQEQTPISNSIPDNNSDTPSDTVDQPASKPDPGPSVTVPGHQDTEGNLVWVPTKGGKKYHSNAACSNMKDPIQVTVEHAIQNGYTPCKKCMQ